MNRYLIKYLIENADSELSKKYIDFFKIELDWHIYNGDKHISKAYHRDKPIPPKKHYINLLHYSYAILSKKSGSRPGEKNILSTVHFPSKGALKDLGYNLFSPIWNAVGRENIFGDLKTLRWHLKIQEMIRTGDFYLFLEPEFHQKLEDFQKELIDQYQKRNFRALFLYTDQYFYSKYNIDIFKKLNRPSFVFSHGLPGLYSKDAENRADYLLVWGEKIRQNYIAADFDEAKVKVVGHPKYRDIPAKLELRSDLSDVLIIPVSSALYHQQRYDETILIDPGMVVLYLYQVQTVLQKLGLKKARYRGHPSTDKKWLHAFLDHNFYIQDNQPIDVSLKRSSLVIGATSTLLFESLFFGVNYMVYEPVDDQGQYLLEESLVPPFDGSERKVMVANSEPELEKMLRFNTIADYSIIHDYIQDFDLTIINKLIN